MEEDESFDKFYAKLKDIVDRPQIEWPIVIKIN